MSDTPFPLDASDWSAIALTLKLAGLVTFLLLVIGTPIAWWLARTRSWWRRPIGAIVALPLVLPPTVLGFYLLLLMGPEGPLGVLTESLGIGLLAFTFPGLVIASLVYSAPFVIQPLQSAFESIGERPLDVAASLGASPFDRFVSVVLPMSRSGYVTATILGFAHTLGEFGVVLMIGGSIPGATRVLSVQIYDHVQAMDYASAHWLSAGLLVFSFVILFGLRLFGPSERRN